jgi:ribosomal protein S18 acetylase RimI-like enzyme
MKINKLTQEDWKIWKAFRLEALKNSPDFFGSSYEEEVNYLQSDWEVGLNNSDIFGAFVDNELVSCIGFFSLKLIKTKHRGVLWGMYTQSKYRGQGIATALMQTIIHHAKAQVTQLHLTCVTSNNCAVALYQKQGFRIYGTEPNALKIGNIFYDEHLMVLNLTKANC